MDESKREQLQEAGWKVGSVKDFLGLSDEEAASVELKLASEGEPSGAAGGTGDHSGGAGSEPVAGGEV